MEFNDKGNAYLKKEILELFTKEDLTRGDIRAYIDHQKDLYEQIITFNKNNPNPPSYGCEKCFIGETKFLEDIKDKITRYKLIFHFSMYQPETAEIMNNHYVYFLSVA